MRGRDKLTELVRGVPLLRDRASMLLSTQVSALIAIVPDDRPVRLETLDGLNCKRVTNSQPETGMASSITLGIASVDSDTDAALIMPADMPDITASDINLLLNAYSNRPDRITRATDEDGSAGSPVIFPRTFFPDLLALKGEDSGRKVIKANADLVNHVALPGTHATLDLDTPEAWVEWRATHT